MHHKMLWENKAFHSEQFHNFCFLTFYVKHFDLFTDMPLKIGNRRAICSMAGLLGYTVSLICPFRTSASQEKQRLQNELEPHICHKTLCLSDLYGKDLLIIGDVHGCFDELLNIIKCAEQRTKRPYVKIFVGDMVNKGPKSEDVLEYLINAKDTYCVRGNHEQKVLKEYFSYSEKPDSVSESRLWVKNLKPRYIDFMKNLPYSVSIPFLSLLIVHAGLVPGKPLALQDTNDMLNMRNLYWQEDDFHGQVLKATYKPNIGESWAGLWKGPEHIYFGHDALRKLQFNNYSTGLDTGCVYGGELSAILLHLNDNMEITDKTVLHVKPSEIYVPVSEV